MTAVNTELQAEILGPFFSDRNGLIERLGATINTFQNIPGLVGLWSMANVDSSNGNVPDMGFSSLDLTNNGVSIFNVYNNLIPYIEFNGLNQSLSIGSTPVLNITGTEAHNAASIQGLTTGGWYRFNSLSGNATLTGKWEDLATNNRSWILQRISGTMRALISTDGASFVLTPSISVSTGIWYFITMRFAPNSFLRIDINDTHQENTTAIPASIFQSNAPFSIGVRNTGILEHFDGDAAYQFLSANVLSNAYINALFQQSRILFNV